MIFTPVLPLVLAAVFEPALVAAPDTLAQQAYIKASNTPSGTNSQFGGAVALSGDTLAVAAIGEDSNAVGVNGNQLDTSAPDAGAVYVFVRRGGTWQQEAYLKASDTGLGDSFGIALALDGDTLVVGSVGHDSSESNSGAAYVFERTAGVWSQQALLVASSPGSSDVFGRAVAVHGDTVVVGAAFEDSSATGVGGSENDDSFANAGAAYVFVRSGTSWTQEAYLKASNTGVNDQFGQAVAVFGDTVVVGAVGEDSNAVGVDGVQTDNSQSSAGAAYVFTRSGTAWSQQAYLKASNTDNNDQFGFALALHDETLVVSSIGEASGSSGVNGNQLDESAGNSGAAYVFTRTGSAWSQQAYLKASNPDKGDAFGIEVALDSDTLVVGAFNESSTATGVDGNQLNDSASSAGAAYVFRRGGSSWNQLAYLKASNTDAQDRFGGACTISGDTIVCGANAESSSATGVNGDQTNDDVEQAGAAYAFLIYPNVFTAHSGCFAINPGVLSSTNDGLALGQTATLDFIAAAFPLATAFLYHGALGTNEFGCGFVLPGLGEMLLGFVPFPTLLAVSAVSIGVCQFDVSVPSNASLLGIEVAFQVVNFDLGGAGAELSDALVSVIAP